jgi:hypothetical protein
MSMKMKMIVIGLMGMCLPLMAAKPALPLHGPELCKQRADHLKALAIDSWRRHNMQDEWWLEFLLKAPVSAVMMFHPTSFAGLNELRMFLRAGASPNQYFDGSLGPDCLPLFLAARGDPGYIPLLLHFGANAAKVLPDGRGVLAVFAASQALTLENRAYIHDLIEAGAQPPESYEGIADEMRDYIQKQFAAHQEKQKKSQTQPTTKK